MYKQKITIKYSFILSPDNMVVEKDLHNNDKDILEIYDLEERFLWLQNRKEFYTEIMEEYKKTGKITKQVKSLRLIVMTSDGRLYLTKRSKRKERNPGLYDKTIGGHIERGHDANTTFVKECVEELGFSAVILNDDKFKSGVKSIDLSIVWIFRQVAYTENFMSKTLMADGSYIEQPFITFIYLGYYDWPIRFKDWEAIGLETFNLQELKEDIKKYPDRFTEDIKFMIEKYKNYLVPVKDL